jgi:23S rRNA (adenine-N6)-dimethyltransferase
VSTLRHSQNFLLSPRLVDRLLDRAGIAADDLVIEIGPGRGVITARLAARCRQVLAVEKDPDLVEKLRGRFADTANVALFAADFLEFPLPRSPYKVFANIPFDVTAAIVGKLTSGVSPPVDSFLAVQREAAARFLGAPRETLAAVRLKPGFAPSVVHAFRPTDFSPVPGVEVVLLRLQRRDVPLVAAEDAARFADLVTFAFTAWQPTVRQALALALPRREVSAIERAADIALDRPPSALPFAAWLDLFGAFRMVMRERGSAIDGARERLERQQAGLRKVHRTRMAAGARGAASRQAPVAADDGNSASRRTSSISRSNDLGSFTWNQESRGMIAEKSFRSRARIGKRTPSKSVRRVRSKRSSNRV